MLKFLESRLIVASNIAHTSFHFLDSISQPNNLHKKDSKFLLFLIVRNGNIIVTSMFSQSFQSDYLLILIFKLFPHLFQDLFHTCYIWFHHVAIIHLRHFTHDYILQPIETLW